MYMYSVTRDNNDIWRIYIDMTFLNIKDGQYWFQSTKKILVHTGNLGKFVSGLFLTYLLIYH